MGLHMDETLFGWVHLSDIHFGQGGAGYGPNQKLVLATLARDIAENRVKARVDAILVTGDLAFSGGRSPSEYPQARDFLGKAAAAAGVEPRAVFLVPGNHDVNREVDEDLSVGPLVEGLREAKRSLDEVLFNPKGRALLAQRMGPYLELAKDFGPWARRAAIPPAEERLFWREDVDGRSGLKVRLVGLNSALVAKERDEGKLCLGERQLAETLEPVAAPGELIIALSHHPFRTGWLADEKNADGWLRRLAHVHLSGHVHEADTEYAGSGGGDRFVRVAAGAAHAERMPVAWVPASHGFSFAEVRRSRDKLVLRVYPRLWSDRRKQFVVDVNNVPDGQTYTEHPLPASTLPPRGAVVSTFKPVLPKAGPVRVFLSYAPEDEAGKRELEKVLAVQRRNEGIQLSSSRGASRGSDPDPELEQAQIILLLFSKNYLASDYHFDVEMKAAGARRGAGEAEVLAVLLSPVDLSTQADYKRIESGQQTVAWFETLPRLPYATGRDQNGHPCGANRDGLPVTAWANADEAWTEIAREIRDQIDALRRKA